jgi:hypothetical protein
MREEEPHLSYLLPKILPLASAWARRLVALRVLKKREMLGLLLLRKKVGKEVEELLRQRSTVLLVLVLQTWRESLLWE